MLLAQLVILAAGTRGDSLQDDDQMAVTLMDFREYQENLGLVGGSFFFFGVVWGDKQLGLFFFWVGGINSLDFFFWVGG